MSSISIQKKSIVDLDADAIVNAANSDLMAGTGVCGAIFQAAGYHQLQKACNEIGHCETGSAVITPGFNLRAKYVIHAVGPIWGQGDVNGRNLLYDAYRSALELAKENDCHSIGFPLISAGIYGYPAERAWEDGLRACGDFLKENPGLGLNIIFAVLDDKIQQVGRRLLGNKKRERSIEKKPELTDKNTSTRIVEQKPELPENNTHKRDRDRFRGCLIGGAAGDALGYAVEFSSIGDILAQYGPNGITEYQLTGGKALVSDDTQMTLFTAAGLLFGTTRGMTRGIMGPYKDYIRHNYMDWLHTQEQSYAPDVSGATWLARVPELYSRRAPGGTCLSALKQGGNGTLEKPINNSKGCGGVMRVAPIGLYFNDTRKPVEEIDRLGAEVAALTHGHTLGWMPAAALVHIIHEVSQDDVAILDAVLHALNKVDEMWPENEHRVYFTNLIEKAIDLASENLDDQNAIRQLGEGWVAEETLAIAIYCALKYPTDFEKALIASVNHSGDSDSTGAVTGNIIGAKLGLSGIPQRFIDHLELKDVILEIADDLYRDCQMGPMSNDPIWTSKYIMGDYRPKEQRTKKGISFETYVSLYQELLATIGPNDKEAKEYAIGIISNIYQLAQQYEERAIYTAVGLHQLPLYLERRDEYVDTTGDPDISTKKRNRLADVLDSTGEYH